MRKHRRKNIECIWVKFMEKVYDGVNMETLWQVRRMYDVVGKLLKGHVWKKNFILNIKRNVIL